MATRFIGVIADTHNQLRPEAISALNGSELIIHAGDVCRPEILEELRGVAPVVAVRGNNDHGHWAKSLPRAKTVRVAGLSIVVVHERSDFDCSTSGGGIDAVISGHSHRPKIEEVNGILFLNPGSAGPRRFKLPVTLARLHLRKDSFRARIIELDV
jgi:putative phosphoesterase